MSHLQPILKKFFASPYSCQEARSLFFQKGFKEIDAHKILQFAQKSSQVTPELLNDYLTFFARQGNSDEVFKGIEMATKEYKIHKDWNIIKLQLYAAKQKVPESLEILSQIGKFGQTISLHDFNFILSKLGNSKKSLLFFEKFWDAKLREKDNGKIPRTFMVMYGQLGEREKAMQWLKFMKDNGNLPSISHFQTLIGTLSAKKDTKNLKYWLFVMERLGMQPDRKMWSGIILNLGKHTKEVETTKLVLGLMKKRGIDPTVFDYNSILIGCSKNGDLDGALFWFGELRKSGRIANTFSFNTIIECLSKKGDVEKSLEWYNRMKSEGVPPDSVTMNLMLAGIAAQRDKKKINEWLTEMGRVQIPSDITTFTSLVASAIQHKDIKETRMWYEKMKEAGLRPDIVTFGTIMNGLLTIQSMEGWEEMDFYTKEMAREGVTKDTNIYYAIIVGLMNRKKFEEAINCWNETQRKKLRMRSYHLGGIFMALAKQGEEEELKRWMERNPATPVFNNLIEQVVDQQADMTQAMRYFTLAKSVNVIPDMVTYCILIQGFVKCLAAETNNNTIWKNMDNIIMEQMTTTETRRNGERIEEGKQDAMVAEEGTREERIREENGETRTEEKIAERIEDEQMEERIVGRQEERIEAIQQEEVKGIYKNGEHEKEREEDSLTKVGIIQNGGHTKYKTGEREIIKEERKRVVSKISFEM